MKLIRLMILAQAAIFLCVGYANAKHGRPVPPANNPAALAAQSYLPAATAAWPARW